MFAFAPPGDIKAQNFARSLGAVWAGASDTFPPDLLEAAIIFAPKEPLVPQALRATQKGGTIVLDGIHMSDIPAMPSSIFLSERVVRSIANLIRQDAVEFMSLAARFYIERTVEAIPLK